MQSPSFLQLPLAVLGMLLAAAPATAAPPAFAEGVVLVGYRPNTPEVARASARATIGATSARQLSPLARNDEKLQLAKGASVEAAVKALLRNPNVRYAHPDYHVNATLDANDPQFTNGSLWGMYGNTTAPANTYGSQAAETWAAGYVGSQQVYVGIIDEGFQFDHEDLADNAWTNPHETPGDGIDNDGNGYIDDIHGWDFFNDDATVYDDSGDDHGTHVAGTIGGRGNNGKGVVGVNWEVGLISAKFLGPSGGYTSDAVAAADYLTDLKLRHGINIVASSNSWGGGGFSQALLDAINRGGDAGILFVAAAGNDASNIENAAYYPSNYQCTTASRSWDCVISVASITSTGGLSSFSNYAATTVDIGAPGSSITSTLPGNTYGSYSGTSMATPHVSGAVALCASIDQNQTAQELRSAVLGSAAPTASLAGRTSTGGRLDAGAMLPACQPPSAAVSGAPSGLAGSASGSKAIALSWTDGVSGESYYEVQRSDASCTAFSTVATLAAGSAAYTATGLTAATTYCFRVRAGNRYPSTTDWSATAQATTATAPTPYQCQASVEPWRDISSGTALPLGDDAEASVALPFTWSFYGVPVTSVKVSSNGFLRLDGGSATAYTNAAIPGTGEPNAIIAPFWDDLNPSAGGTVRTAVVGNAPSRRFIVSWDNVPHYSLAGSTLSFQVVIEEDTGQVVMAYSDIIAGSVSYDGGASATVGFEDAAGEYGTQLSYNSASLADGTAKRCAAGALPPPPVLPPATPSGLTATAGSSQVSVSWQSVSGATSYTLQRATGSAGSFADVLTAQNVLSYTDTPVAAGTLYRYQVRANNSAGSSAYSAAASASIAPAVPTGLATSGVTASSITLSWSAAAGAANYTVQWSPNGTGNWSNLVTQAGTSYTHTGLTAGTTYYYHVRSNSTEAGSSTYSGNASATTTAAATVPAAPSNVAASLSGTTITVTWRDRSSNETGFDIGRQRSTGGLWSATELVGSVGANTTIFSQAPGTGTFRYYVRSKNASGTSAWVGPSQSRTVR